MKKTISFLLLPPLFLLALLLGTIDVAAQTSQVRFGKNRVQHHRDFDEWLKYESDNFITYWYGEGRNIGQAVVQLAEYDFNFVQSILEHRINEKLQIIVYTDISDLKQSNIGNEEVFSTAGGQTKIVGNKIFVYFNGDHNHLRRQIREGIATVYLEAMLFGSNLQEMVQNAVLLNLPEWFKQGLIAYIGEPWNTVQDDQLRQLLDSEDYVDFATAAEENPNLIGHAFWYYIAELYGTPTVSNLLYLTRINRSVESGFLYVLGTPYAITLNDWEKYFRQRYDIDARNRQAITGQEIFIKNRWKARLTQAKISPDGQQLAYVLNDIGRYRIYLQNLLTGERKLLFKRGSRNQIQSPDYNYPILAWNPSGQELAILYEHRDIPKLMRYSLLEKTDVTEDLSTGYHRVYSMEYVNPSTMVFSATQRGFSDIFLYYPATRQTQRITTDFWDDLDAVPVKVRDRTGILFASNRTDVSLDPQRLDTILPITTFDLYYYDLSNRPGELVRVTDTPLANERSPEGINSQYFTYLSDRNGIFNREVGYLEDYIDHYEQNILLTDGSEIVLHADSSLTLLDTTLIDTIIIQPVIKERAIVGTVSNYGRNLLRQDFSRTGRKLETFATSQPGTYQLVLSTIDSLNGVPGSATIFQYLREERLGLFDEPIEAPTPETVVEAEAEAEAPVNPPMQTEVLPPVETFEPDIQANSAAVDSIEVIDIDNYLFQSEFAEEDAFEETPEDTGPAEEVTTEAPASTDLLEIVDPIPPGQVVASSRKDSGPKVHRFRPSRIVNYRTTFRTDFVSFNMDNSLLFEGLDSYAANPQGFNIQPVGMLLKMNFKDLLEDYVIEGGVRVPVTFNGTEYFLTVHDRKRRLDKFYAFYRRAQRFNEPFNQYLWKRENNVLIGQYGLRYPLDVFQSLRATATLRRDRVQYSATDQFAIERAPEPTSTQRIGARLEYVFDNTINLGLNLLQGTRAKVYTEFFKQFSAGLQPNFNFSFNEGYMGVIGLDARHYVRLDKRSILAFRLAGATSFGSDRVLFYLGGADQQLFSGFNSTIPVPTDNPPGLVGLANSMRGFDINIRNGNTYVLANAELRVPIFRYLNDQIQSPFFRNFQVVGFFDAGTAWSGPDPYSDDNPLNTSTFPENTTDFAPVEIKVVYFRDPLVYSYGVGARTQLFGYFLRLDYAWGLETRNVLEPRLHLSMGMDF
ncbi:MAG: hypothetical protein AAGJ82_03795 [Bacteroidota bacterium]